MRTIIINTLGSELRQNPLFYLPFSGDRFHWIEQPLETVDACVEQICCYNAAQDTWQDSHLVVLVSLAHYERASYAQLRAAYKECLFAHLNTKLLLPLVQESKQQLVGVSVVYVLPQPREGTCGIPAEDINLHVLGVKSATELDNAFALVDDNGKKTIDLRYLFSKIINDYQISRQNAIDNGDTETQVEQSVKFLRTAVADQLQQMQICKYLRPGKEEPEALPIQQEEYWLPSSEWELFSVDLQLNLSEHLQKHISSESVWKLELTPHGVDEIRERIQLAIARVEHLQSHTPQLAFYSLTAEKFATDSVCGDIWEKLQGCDPKLPGVKEAYLDSTLEEAALQDAIKKEKNGLAKKLRKTWLLLGLAKKRFDGYYNILQEQYAQEPAAKQQTAVLDICADTFATWRRKLLSRKPGLPSQVTENEMPVFDWQNYEEQLQQTQQQWGEAAVSQVEDYTDVREEAEKVKADFRKAYRLWPDGEFNATSKFLVYSASLAVVFLLQMLLPYILITMGQEGVELSRYVHFSLSLLMFVSLYAIGLLIWMRALCKQLNRYTEKMYWLLQDSHFRRRQSIVRAVECYGSILPRCAASYERLQMLRMIHEENLQRKERYNSHAKLLAKAEELLHELRSLLRMPEEMTGEQIKVNGGINFELPPSHPKNMPYYVFLSDKWGRF